MRVDLFDLARPWWRPRRVGVLGMWGAGKTVLLTALIDHLLNHRGDRLPIDLHDRSREVVPIPPAPRPPKVCPATFPFRQVRKAFGEGRWPAPTETLSEYRVELDVGRRVRLMLSLYDLPGDRMSDLVVARHKTHAGWSDAVLALLEEPELRPHAADYLGLLRHAAANAATPDADALAGAYRVLLARLYEHYLPLASPSGFILDAAGVHQDSRLPDLHGMDLAGRVAARAAAGWSGLDQRRQFVPLPPGLRERFPDLAAACRSHYAQYRAEVVMPFAEALYHCDELLVLVDATALLMGGHAMFNAYSTFLEHAMRYLAPGLTVGDRLLGWYGRHRIAGVTVVGTKADRALAADHENLRGLVEELVRPVLRPYAASRGLKVDCVVVAAVVSTSEQDGKLHWDEAGRRRSAEPSRVPGSWPARWREGEYRFPDPTPHMPANRNAVPVHRHLDEVARIVLGESRSG